MKGAPRSRPGPNFTELLKQDILLLNNFLLSRNEQVPVTNCTGEMVVRLSKLFWC